MFTLATPIKENKFKSEVHNNGNPNGIGYSRGESNQSANYHFFGVTEKYSLATPDDAIELSIALNQGMKYGKFTCVEESWTETFTFYGGKNEDGTYKDVYYTPKLTTEVNKYIFFTLKPEIVSKKYNVINALFTFRWDKIGKSYVTDYVYPLEQLNEFTEIVYRDCYWDPEQRGCSL